MIFEQRRIVPATGTFFAYDDQAATFDERVGLPDRAIAAFCATIINYGGLAAGDLAVEIGAGTGRLGIDLITRRIRYLGIDRSWPMLAVFRRRLSADLGNALLVQADGNGTWPLADASAQVVFGLRALHHLDLRHTCAEVLRVLRPDGALLIGRVERPEDSMHARLRRRMHWLVREHGAEPKQAGRAAAQLIEELCRHGAAGLPPRTVARWATVHTPAGLIDGWTGKRGLGGLDLPESSKRSILSALRDWADGAFDGLDTPRHWEERLVCRGVRRTASPS